ncbi:MAG: rod shape-determining protein MreD [Spirochaetales bacterium]|nr:rod shape-determining protein MreD [Spirochaetales bacterium]
MNRIPWQIHIGISTLLVLLQTTLFRFIEVKGVSPDIVLIFVVFSANSKGAFRGEIVGFTSGLLEDLLSLAPLGFNSLIKTVIGYLFGKTRGKILFDPFLLPLLYILIATLIKELLSFLVSFLFLRDGSGYFNISFLLQTGFNLVLTPFIFNIFKKIKIFGENEREMI